MNEFEMEWLNGMPDYKVMSSGSEVEETPKKVDELPHTMPGQQNKR